MIFFASELTFTVKFVNIFAKRAFREQVTIVLTSDISSENIHSYVTG